MNNEDSLIIDNRKNITRLQDLSVGDTFSFGMSYYLKLPVGLKLMRYFSKKGRVEKKKTEESVNVFKLDYCGVRYLDDGSEITPIEVELELKEEEVGKSSEITDFGGVIKFKDDYFYILPNKIFQNGEEVNVYNIRTKEVGFISGEEQVTRVKDRLIIKAIE